MCQLFYHLFSLPNQVRPWPTIDRQSIDRSSRSLSLNEQTNEERSRRRRVRVGGRLIGETR